MTTLYAQPYDICATGFYFESREEYAAKATKAVNSYGWPVEEFEIQFINGDAIDAQLFHALGVHQGSFAAFLDAVEAWSEVDKVKVAIAAGEGGCQFNLGHNDPDDLEIDLYECDSLRDLAMQFVDDGLFGEIPPAIANYLDYDAIAHDLSADYAEITINDTRYAYRLG